MQQGYEEKVYRLKKDLYGLKQAPRAWCNHIDAYLAKQSFQKCPNEHTSYVKDEEESKMLIKYIQEVVERFQMPNCNPVGIPTEIGLKLSRDLDGVRVDTTFYKHFVGSLMYLASTRPDIMYVVSLIRRYMENPT
ncbi:unnamed protein product [Prunus armeniaca]